MSVLEIRKKGSKHFRHYNEPFKSYASNDITIIFEGDTVKLRSVAGRVIFLKDGWDYSNIRVYDETDAGSEESFPSVDGLHSRLIALGYPFLGLETTIVSTTFADITGSPTSNPALVAYVESETGIINGGTP
jgi:hypothetical protein